ncbi:MAG: hypothetical protein COU31_04835 [Candidatus Magasanikbacteria bacterium CG10_big_fil_rev_8_21_14_0_10_40_10]|uniref:Uncharacterized protein n=1 Tax=Candidatus Magasanikbacteria bacterium CG10_big_fil_rev_8_21_14_0_10_40_10 TaxID=1974648 RepID=A0A2M6W2P3_9BACT|nr:MAG: hypothetical protein COU31_04835 [Candidatus Magasanikbacteria bacterium CG10_big_fil_rev_8_21_14_0_10_40_10]
MTQIIEQLNNRELATLTWLFLFLLWVAFRKDSRDSISNLLKSFFHKKIITPIFLMGVYMSAIIYVLSKVGLWDLFLLKDTLYWFLFVGFALLFNSNTAIYNKKDYFRKIIVDNLKLVVLIEFIVNFYTLNYFTELIIVPVITTIVLLNTYSGIKEKYIQVKKITDFILGFTGILFIIFALHNILFNYKILITSHNLIPLVLPAILSITLIPYLFLFILLMKYEILFFNKVSIFYKKIKQLLNTFFKKVWGFKKSFITIGALTLLISISQNISSRSQLEFSFSGTAGGTVVENGKPYYQFRHGGIIKNKSKEKNTITKISLIVWEDKTKEKTLRDGFGPDWMIDNRTGEKIKLPLVVEGREAMDVDIYNKLYLEGTEDYKLLMARKPIVPGSPFTLPKYDYQLTFTDINDNEFDEQGKLINRDVINMNWTLSNYCGEVHYKFWPCLKEKLKIADCKFMFKIKNIFHWLGMESIGDLIYKSGTYFEK